jgi:hypothetical protein
MSFSRDPSLTKSSVYAKIGSQSRGTIAAVDRRPTAEASMQAFYTSVDSIRKDNTQNNFGAVLITAVGLKIDNRRSAYDLFYIVNTGTVYAVDTQDDSFVAFMVMPPAGNIRFAQSSLSKLI